MNRPSCWIDAHLPLNRPFIAALTMQPALRPSLYEQLEALPEGLTGEILNG